MPAPFSLPFYSPGIIVRRLPLLLVLVSIIGAGCLGPSKAHHVDQASTTKVSDGAADPEPPGSYESGDTRAITSNTTNDERSIPPWPDASVATIRPGVRLSSPGHDCTSNFLFRDATNRSLYLGTVAHCVTGILVGDPVTIQGAHDPGTLAYSSWKTEELADCEDEPSTKCSNDDFALVLINATDRAHVHPAVRHYGGPVDLGDPTRLEVGDWLKWYGNTDYHNQVEDTNHHDGIVVAPEGESGSPVNGFGFVALLPSMFGDSGSGIMDESGIAMGILTGTTIYGMEVALSVAGQLEAAKDAGSAVDLVTWPLSESS